MVPTDVLLKHLDITAFYFVADLELKWAKNHAEAHNDISWLDSHVGYMLAPLRC